MKGTDFNKYFEITVKKDIDNFKAGSKVCFNDSVTIVADTPIKPILNDIQVNRARVLLQEGKSYRDIAKEFNVSHMTIYRALKSR